MKLTVISATGGIGRALTEQAVSAGHDVTAVARRPTRIAADVHTVGVDLDDPSASAAAMLESAVAGADAVLSGLGPRSRTDAGIAARGTSALIRALKAGGSRRLIVVSAAPVSTVPTRSRPNPPKHDPGNGFWANYLLYPAIGRILRGHYADLARMEEALRGSGLDWTTVRPPRLTDGPLTGIYRTALDRNVRGGLKISRADVAHLMLALTEQPETVGRAVGCGY